MKRLFPYLLFLSSNCLFAQVGICQQDAKSKGNNFIDNTTHNVQNNDPVRHLNDAIKKGIDCRLEQIHRAYKSASNKYRIIRDDGSNADSMLLETKEYLTKKGYVLTEQIDFKNKWVVENFVMYYKSSVDPGSGKMLDSEITFHFGILWP